MSPRLRWTLAILVVLAAGAGAGWAALTRPHLPPAERGRRLAQRTGCFTCHGPGGLHGAPNPGRPFPQVPTFSGDLMMYAPDADAVREWIRDGVSAARAKSASWKAARDSGALVMPAFGDRLSDDAVDDLVAFVVATGATPVPDDSLARHGMERARDLGCFACHGPGGRFAPRNPGAFKGVIPSWDGGDFPEVVRNRDEFAEWVEHGISERFAGNPFARFFLDRAAIRMPAFERFLEPGDTDALWAYVTWLRSADTASH